MDVRQRAILAELRAWALSGRPLDRDAIVERIFEDFVEPKAAIAFGDLWQALVGEGRTPGADEVLSWIPPEKTGFTLMDPAGEPVHLTPEEVDQSHLANFSVYLVKTRALHFALARLDRTNAQQQEYLSDIITILAQARFESRPRFRVRALQVSNPNYVMAFNDPAELLEIEEYMQSKRQALMASELSPSPAYRTTAAWQELFAQAESDQMNPGEPLWQELAAIYGDDPKRSANGPGPTLK